MDCPLAIWCHLSKVQELAEARIRWSLGEGLVDFWNDSWYTDTLLASLVPEYDKSHMLVGELFRSTGWDELRLYQWLPGHIVDRIL